MDVAFNIAVANFIAKCAYVVAAHDLINKWRIDLIENYAIDLFHNAATGKYSYTLVFQNRRVLGWDNALHHPDLKNYPHHLHLPDGTLIPSRLNGIPAQDIETVRLSVEIYLQTKTIPTYPA